MTRRLPRLLVLTVSALALGVIGCGAPPAQQGAGTPAAAPVSAAPNGVPSGTIVAYFGTEIPAGWVICDGRETSTGRLTPDLRGRFVMGLDPATAALGERGGSASHRHSGKTGEPNEDDEDLDSGDDEHAANDGHTHNFTTGDVNHLPPFVRLVLIMKE